MPGLLTIDALPRKTTAGELLAWLCSTGGLDSRQVGKIELRGSGATVEVPEEKLSRLVHKLDGARFRDTHVRAGYHATPPPVKTASRTRPTGDHFTQLLRWLQLEREADTQRLTQLTQRLSPAEAERSGQTIIQLVIDDVTPGLGGRFIATLVKKSRGTPLPWTRLNTGTPVLLSSEDERDAAAPLRGVVSLRDEQSISVVVNDIPEETGGTWRIDLSGDEVAFQRQVAAIQRVQRTEQDRLAEFREMALGERTPRFSSNSPKTRSSTSPPPTPAMGDDHPSRHESSLTAAQPAETSRAGDDLGGDDGLNDSQRGAVEWALTADDVALIQGPPGTGKTTTLVEIIRRAVARGERVLACAPSNTAVDNLLEKLVAYGLRAIRLGHPARVQETLREHTLDLLVDEHPDVKLSRKFVKEAAALFRKARKFTRAAPEPGAKREMRQEARDLLQDARRIEAAAVEYLLDGADVLCATLTGLDSELLGQRRFPLAVIDEACQTTEPACWIPLLRAERVIMAGDQCQLPPTVLSQVASHEGFRLSLFERLLDLHGPAIWKRLSVQYRMHETIGEFSSLEFYDGELVPHASVRHHTLADLLSSETGSPPSDDLWLLEPVEFIDTAGAGYDEELEPDGESRQNPQEARLLVRKVQHWLDQGLSPGDIGIITPYAAQVRYLREILRVPGLEIDTVDGFQGREKEAIAVSLVRSNPEGEVGFLGDTRRMNVALTRARRKLLVIGDSATLSHHPFYQRLLDYLEQKSVYHTIWEEPAES